jgi:predicted RNase H-like HicB family nuclease
MTVPTYTVLFQYFKDPDAEGYQVFVPALPEIVTWGRTLEEAKASAREAIDCVVESMTGRGEQLPPDVATEPVVHVEHMPVRA